MKKEVIFFYGQGLFSNLALYKKYDERLGSFQIM